MTQRNLTHTDPALLQRSLGNDLNEAAMKRYLQLKFDTDPKDHAIVYALVCRAVDLQERIELLSAEDKAHTDI